MLKLFRKNGVLKIPTKAYRSFGNEFLIYVTDFGETRWEDIYANRLCILNCRPCAGFLKELQIGLDYLGFTDYVIIEAVV